MDLAALRIFKAVVEHGGINRAAAKLHRVPSNITTRVRGLEEQLGTKLFVRDGRRLVLNLTKSGRATAEKSPPVTQEKIIEALERMSAAERRRFADTFTRIIEEMGEGRESPPMMFEEVRGGRHTAKK